MGHVPPSPPQYGLVWLPLAFSAALRQPAPAVQAEASRSRAAVDRSAADFNAVITAFSWHVLTALKSATAQSTTARDREASAYTAGAGC